MVRIFSAELRGKVVAIKFLPTRRTFEMAKRKLLKAQYAHFYSFLIHRFLIILSAFRRIPLPYMSQLNGVTFAGKNSVPGLITNGGADAFYFTDKY